ncbi:hypothetical protein PEV8663_04575 [Pelagimonas varians]|uniref:Uncharacterized protein n=1 Tax=Pelagimonas varians TaxID=696760 RepID=A0A238L633_9RHOB|nr:hypothetical protein PEV8663_04575 [Pelagimonas varians]
MQKPECDYYAVVAGGFGAALGARGFCSSRNTGFWEGMRLSYPPKFRHCRKLRFVVC